MRYSPTFRTSPWTVVVDGHCGEAATTLDIDSLRKLAARLEERIYRMRCVEAWSMVIPWVGVPLGAVIKRFEPTSKAKYVAFKTVLDPHAMPGQTKYWTGRTSRACGWTKRCTR